MAHASWAEAIQNVQSGNVSFADNRLFLFDNFYVYQGDGWDFAVYPKPAKEVVIDLKTAQANTDYYVEFRDGSRYGLCYLGGDDYEMWFYRANSANNVYTTHGGQPCCILLGGNFADTFTYTYQPTPVDVPIDVTMTTTELRMSIGWYHWQDNPQEGNPMEFLYVSKGEAVLPTLGTLKFDYPYTEKTSVCPWGTWGDMFSNSGLYGYEWVDFLASRDAEPVAYPGGEYSYSVYGGGDGTYTDEGAEPVPMPNVPDIQTINLGFVSLYHPSEQQVRQMAIWLWDSDFATNVKKNYTSPFENIISLGMVPVPITDASSTLLIGNVNSDISMPKVTNQYIRDYSMGSIYVPGYWRAFMDFDNVNYTIWLPFVGYRSIKASEVIDCNLKVSYNIDLLTGNAVCCILNDKYFGEYTVLYTYNCNILSSIPISGANFMSQYNQQLSATVAGNQNFLSTVGNAVGSALNGNLGDAVMTLFGGAEKQKLIDRQMQTAKPEYGRGGNLGGSMGTFATRYPYLIKSRPDIRVPEDYNEFVGIPAFVKDNLANLTGYTEVYATNINIDCTAKEKEEIAQLLSSGVYL